MVEAMGVHVDRGGAVGRAAALLCVVAFAQSALAGPASADTGDDAKVVFCLSSARRGELADAAVALDLPRFADPFAWRREHRADFDRACDALFESQKPSGSSVLANLLPFLTGLLGALLTYAATAWRDRITRGKQTGDALRAAVGAFHDAVSLYLDSVGTGRSDEKVVSTRGNLITQLAAVRDDHPRWAKPAALEAMLTTGELGASLSAGWTGQGQETTARTERLTRALDGVRGDVLTVAKSLGKPLLPGDKGGGR